MTEGSAERVEAAATGAAAAVAAVEDQQADEARSEAMEAATTIATGSAEIAAQEADEAAEAARQAAEAAAEATQRAEAASDVAGEAAAEAYDVRADMNGLREEMQQGWSTLRTYLDEKFNPPASDEPTEVVVTHESADSTPERGTNGGSDNSTRDRDDERPPRHRFGHSRR